MRAFANRHCLPKLKADLLLLILLAFCWAGGANNLLAKDKDHPPVFLPEERRIIQDYFHGAASGLPPGLAKRGGKLPPGLQKHLDRNGSLPPGLQKRLRPFPTDLEEQLPTVPEIWSRVILGRDVILLDRRTNRILDIIEDVVGLLTNQ
jgi:hypothetical protein